jgi:pimeloyl-ACP methyl ester carboxylesterase
VNWTHIWRLIRRVWVTLGIAVLVVFTGWSLLAYRASPAAHMATRSDTLVSVTHDVGEWRFEPAPAAARNTTSLLFFPGALVDPVAYAPIARAAASAGFPTTILELPRRGAFGGADDPALLDAARAIISRRDGTMRWVVAGHSRGAVVASLLAYDTPKRMAGLVLIGSSHPRDVSLAALSVPVTKIAGTRDGLASPDEVRQNAHNLPARTRWIWIEGGNHSQFGWYGFQPGDRRPRITAEAQHSATIDAVLAMLREVSVPPR